MKARSQKFLGIIKRKEQKDGDLGTGFLMCDSALPPVSRIYTYHQTIEKYIGSGTARVFVKQGCGPRMQMGGTGCAEIVSLIPVRAMGWG